MIFEDIPIAKQILATNNPKQHKALGRKVRNFDAAKWRDEAKIAVKTGNMAKVSAAINFGEHFPYFNHDLFKVKLCRISISLHVITLL